MHMFQQSGGVRMYTNVLIANVSLDGWTYSLEHLDCVLTSLALENVSHIRVSCWYWSLVLQT